MNGIFYAFVNFFIVWLNRRQLASQVCFFVGLLSLHDFYKILQWSLGNISSRTYADLIKCVDAFHFMVLNSCIREYHHQYHQKVFKCQEAVKLIIVDTTFPKCQFSHEIFNFINGNKHHQLFFSEMFTSYVFEKLSSKYTRWSNHSLSVILSSKKRVVQSDLFSS